MDCLPRLLRLIGLPAFIEPEVFVVAALNAVDWVIVSPLRFACVATLGAVLSAFGFVAMMCFQRFVTGALMELAWETDRDDHVSTSAGTENVSIGNVFEMEGRCGVDLGFKTLVGCCWFAELQKLNVCPGSWLLGVRGCRWSFSGVILPPHDDDSASGSSMGRLRRKVCVRLSSNDGWYVPESLVASVAGALKRHAIKKAQQAAAASAAATCHSSCLPRVRV